MSGYTKGPWKICYDGQIDSSDGKFICAFRWDSFREINESNNAANARLIAAAPDLLEALKFALHRLEAVESPVFSVRHAIDKAKAAIAKAEAQS
jgi:hypothetical protein